MRKINKKFTNPTDRSKYRRKLYVRSKIKGSASIPRICVTKSNKNLFVQAIDDDKSLTLFTVQSFGKKSSIDSLSAESAKSMAVQFAATAKDKNLLHYKFDRSGNKYSGLIKVFAESLRENGLRL
jgi:large subunit ribosomal protein L18